MLTALKSAFAVAALAAAAAAAPTKAPDAAKAPEKKPAEKGAPASAASDVVTVAKDQEGNHPAITSDAKGTIYVTYAALEGKSPDIFFTSSKDGKTWSK